MCPFVGGVFAPRVVDDLQHMSAFSYVIWWLSSPMAVAKILIVTSWNALFGSRFRNDLLSRSGWIK
jgi:hypothetical protein